MTTLNQKINSPQSIDELLARAHQWAGLNLTELSNHAGMSCPSNLRRHKGFRGQLLEYLLGADAGNQNAPDFLALGVELKTLPVTADGAVIESTFICAAPIPFLENHFLTSSCYKKMKNILFVPIEASKDIPLSKQRVGRAFLWSPNATQYRALENDWNELTEKMILGQWDSLSAHLGEHLQIRPKAADHHVKTATLDELGERHYTGPKGFYLRRSFTQAILDTQAFD